MIRPIPDNAPEILDRLIARSIEIPSLIVGIDLPCWVIKEQTHLGYAMAGEIGAHRLAFHVLRGEIPEGLVLDHLCGFKPCWNPWHLDPVTQKINVQRAPRIRANRRKVIKRWHWTDAGLIPEYTYVPAKHVRDKIVAV